MTKIPQSQWPKTYLLQVLEAAVKEGCVRLPFHQYGSDAERMALSFQGAINRIRRRSDKQHRSFIVPEYHLVTTTWEAGNGTMLISYSSLPDNIELPKILSISDAEKQSLSSPIVQQPAFDPPAPQASGPAQPVGPVDTDQLINDLLKSQGLS